MAKVWEWVHLLEKQMEFLLALWCVCVSVHACGECEGDTPLYLLQKVGEFNDLCSVTSKFLSNKKDTSLKQV